MTMRTRLDLAEALPRCFPLPRSVVIGSQQWTVTVSALHVDATGQVQMSLLLSGPYARYRKAAIAVDAEGLLAGRYDPQAATQAIRRWLPNSDDRDVLRLDGVALLPAADLAQPAHD
jgi:hypothetical protein